MKNRLFLFTLALTLTSQILKAEKYDFSYRTETYSEFTDGTAVISGATSTPFPFQFFNTIWNKFYIDINAVSFVYITGLPAWIAPYFNLNAMRTDGSSKITTKLIGNEGSRIFKVQYKNLALGGNKDRTDYLNYQIWLYETTNKIEFHFGPTSILDSASYNSNTGPGFLLIDLGKGGGLRLALTGDAQNPTPDSTSSTPAVKGYPANGMVYVYKMRGVIDGIQTDRTKQNSTFYYHSKENKMYFKWVDKPTSLLLTDISGRTVFSQSSGFPENSSRLPELSPGLYIAQVTIGRDMYIRKFVIE